jgi:hypothetical protein
MPPESHRGTVPSERGSGTQRLADAPPQDSPAATIAGEEDADQSVLKPLGILVLGPSPIVIEHPSYVRAGEGPDDLTSAVDVDT